MKPKILYQGAEAIIFKVGNKVVKDRIEKKYRLPEIDLKIRKRRTKKEAKLLDKASKIINCPKPLSIPKSGRMIHMPYLPGKKLSQHLDKLKNKTAVCNQIGEQIAKLHDNNIIHGDLTTSNMILSKEKVFFIDFGLGFQSQRIEDKAVDIHLIKQTLEAKHFENWGAYYKNIIKGYKKSKNFSKVLEQLKKVETRGRYKDKQ